jgi:hypothetical protein
MLAVGLARGTTATFIAASLALSSVKSRPQDSQFAQHVGKVQFRVVCLEPLFECGRDQRISAVVSIRGPHFGSFQRSDLNAPRISLLKSSGSSHAAKWPPLSTSLK